MPTALIVEDEPDANQLLAMLVQLRGYKTTSAFTGKDALLEVGRSQPDLVFLDLMLPDLDGYDVCRTLRSAVETTAIPVVMVTARLAIENRVEGFRAGAIDYVPKPYTPDQIFGAMVQAKTWRSQVELGLESISIRFDGPGDVESLRDMSRLRSTLLFRRLLNDARAQRLDQFLQSLTALLTSKGREPINGLTPVIDYERKADRIFVRLHNIDARWIKRESITADSSLHSMRIGRTLGDLIDSGPFETVDIQSVDGKMQVVLSCSTTLRIAARPTAL